LNIVYMKPFGEPVPANNLPLAFSVAELSGDKGWKAQLEAAERLSKSGVFSDNQLLGLLTKKPAPASGGIWDRVTMIQDLEQALEANAPARISGCATHCLERFGHFGACNADRAAFLQTPRRGQPIKTRSCFGA
jgi:hypothetical protein